MHEPRATIHGIVEIFADNYFIVYLSRAAYLIHFSNKSKYVAHIHSHFHLFALDGFHTTYEFSPWLLFYCYQFAIELNDGGSKWAQN